MDISIGEKYKVIRLLGRGAFAEVYLAEDCAGGTYACKVSERAELLEREAECQKGIMHPLFPTFFDFWRRESRGCILMEYVPGESLESILHREGALQARRAAEIGIRLAEGLRYLHERSTPLIFRDVKPSNVMVTPEGGVKLLDLGCVCPAGKCTDRAGTPGFAAPEQFEPGEMQGAAADVYGLGRTLQEMLGGNGRGLLKKIADKCTVSDPGERLPDMWETAELLRLCTRKRRGKMSSRQKALLQGKLRVVKDILIS